MFLTTHVTVCLCHAELKGYLLTYVLIVLILKYMVKNISYANCYFVVIYIIEYLMFQHS